LALRLSFQQTVMQRMVVGLPHVHLGGLANAMVPAMGTNGGEVVMSSDYKPAHRWQGALLRWHGNPGRSGHAHLQAASSACHPTCLSRKKQSKAGSNQIWCICYQKRTGLRVASFTASRFGRRQS
jgi:hypothetical protein